MWQNFLLWFVVGAVLCVIIFFIILAVNKPKYSNVNQKSTNQTSATEKTDTATAEVSTGGFKQIAMKDFFPPFNSALSDFSLSIPENYKFLKVPEPSNQGVLWLDSSDEKIVVENNFDFSKTINTVFWVRWTLNVAVDEQGRFTDGKTFLDENEYKKFITNLNYKHGKINGKIPAAVISGDMQDKTIYMLYLGDMSNSMVCYISMQGSRSNESEKKVVWEQFISSLNIQ